MDFSSNAGMGDYKGVIIAELDSPEWRKIRPDSIPEKEANARFIVRACNNFEEMRHALEMVVRDLDNRQLQSGTICVREIARDVLARIEGGE